MDIAGDNQELVHNLARWWEQRKPGARDVSCRFYGQPKAGMSNDTRFIALSWLGDDGPQEELWVLRMGTGVEPIHPLQTKAVSSSVELQYRVMAALFSDGHVPVPKLSDFEPDASIIGQPFFMIGFVDGWAAQDFPSFVEEGRFRDASPSARRVFFENGLQQLAQIHKVDWERAGLQWLDRAGSGPRMPQQLKLWNDYAAPIFAKESFPVLRSSLAWLQDAMPSEPSPSLIWGDARPQNIIFNDAFDPLSMMDWEGAAILPAEADIAYWLISDYMAHERVGAERLEGTPTREEQLQIYTQLLGREVENLEYYKVFGLMTIAATLYNVFTLLINSGNPMNNGETPSNNYYSVALENQLLKAKSAGA